LAEMIAAGVVEGGGFHVRGWGRGGGKGTGRKGKGRGTGRSSARSRAGRAVRDRWRTTGLRGPQNSGHRKSRSAGKGKGASTRGGEISCCSSAACELNRKWNDDEHILLFREKQNGPAALIRHTSIPRALYLGGEQLSCGSSAAGGLCT
jgi:hypothetical protein